MFSMESEKLIKSANGLQLMRQHYRQRLRKPRNWHEFWLRYCCELALNGLGRVAPNPLTGAVLVRTKNNDKTGRKFSQAELLKQQDACWDGGDWHQHFELLGQGYHAAWGQLHAEAAAFADAQRRGYGRDAFHEAILYCNLEPCCFRAAQKRQPPCCEQIIHQQVGTVIFANTDPNPAVAGNGAETLRRVGISVRNNDYALPSAQINQIFFRSMQNPSRPWVTLKLAQSLDGYIATKSKHSRWISGPRARDMVQALRAGHGAARSGVMVGRRTLEADDPSLLLRPQFLRLLASGEDLNTESRYQLNGQQPWRIVWDSQLTTARLPLQFYRSSDRNRSIVIYHRATEAERQATQQSSGIASIGLSASLRSATGLCEGLTALSRGPYKIQYLLLEGGSQLASSFLAAGLVDEIYCFVSQRLLGSGLNSLQDLWPQQPDISLEQSLQLSHSSSMTIAEGSQENWNGPDEILCHGYLHDIVIP